MLALLIIFSIFVSGCKAEEKKQVTETTEEVVDTGVLVVESSPSSAQVYVSEEFKGDSPVTLYNLPVGKYDITVKKEGYADFKKTATVKVGKTEKVDVTLNPVVEETKPTLKEPEKPAQENVPTPAAQLNKINLSSFAMYFDLDNKLFTEIRTEKTDIFARRYDTYVYFTALAPAKIYVLDKPLKDITKEDCIFSDTAATTLFSKQTICVKTMEGAVFAVSWQASPTELEWALLS